MFIVWHENCIKVILENTNIALDKLKSYVINIFLLETEYNPSGLTLSRVINPLSD